MLEASLMTITAELVTFMLVLLGALWGVWWKVAGLVDKARNDAISVADKARADSINAALVAQTKADILHTALHEHRLHVAETYVSKSGLREQTEQIMTAIKDVGSHVATINERLDRFVDSRATVKTKPAPD